MVKIWRKKKEKNLKHFLKIAQFYLTGTTGKMWMECEGLMVETYGRHDLLTLMVLDLWLCTVLTCAWGIPHYREWGEQRSPHCSGMTSSHTPKWDATALLSPVLKGSLIPPVQVSTCLEIQHRKVQYWRLKWLRIGSTVCDAKLEGLSCLPCNTLTTKPSSKRNK